MKKHSAGILLYKMLANEVQVFIGHPGSPLWAKKDLGVWTIPKGMIDENESVLEAAKREFCEETGLPAPTGELIELGDIEQYGRKKVSIWAALADMDTSKAKSNNFQLEWPPKSGKMQNYPELDRLEWFGLGEASKRLNHFQAEFIVRLAGHLEIDFELPTKPEQGQLQLK